MNGQASNEQALTGTTCGIHCRRPGRSAPNRCPTLHLQKIAADGDEGFDAAVEASVLPRKEEGLLREGGVYAKTPHDQSLLNLPLSMSQRCGAYISSAGGMLQATAGRWYGGSGDFNNEDLLTGNTAKGAGGSSIGRLLEL